MTTASHLQAEQEIRGTTGVVKYIAQFNKFNGQYMTMHHWHENWALEQTYSKYIEVEFDPSLYGHVGNYDDFRIVPIDEVPVPVLEEQLDTLASDKILRDYSYGKQLNILGASILTLAEHVGCPLPELEEMVSAIAETLRKNDLRKESHAANPESNYVSKEDAAATLSRQLEGGLHEALGPRKISS